MFAAHAGAAPSSCSVWFAPPRLPSPTTWPFPAAATPNMYWGVWPRPSTPGRTGTASSFHLPPARPAPLRDVSEGSAALGRVGRALSAEESGRGLTYLPGREPVVVVAGAGVTARHITATQLVDVYRGRITDWQALGGAPGPIRAIGREGVGCVAPGPATGSSGRWPTQFAASVKVVNLDPQLIELRPLPDQPRHPQSFRPRRPQDQGGVSPRRRRADPPTTASGRHAAGIEFGLIYRDGRLPAGRAFRTSSPRPRGAHPERPRRHPLAR